MDFNNRFSKILREMADLLEITHDNPFRIRALRRGSEVVEAQPTDLSTLAREEQLQIDGVGQGIADYLEEFTSKGRLHDHDTLRKKFPAGVLQMLTLQGLGPKRVGQLFKELKIDSLEKLKKAAEGGKIRLLKGFGEKLESSLVGNIAFAEESSKRVLLYEGLLTAREIEQKLSGSAHIQQLALSGSARRWKETIGDLDFLCVSTQPEKAIRDFIDLVPHAKILAQGDTKASILLTDSLQCDFRVVPEASFGAALLYFTGSKEHNVRIRELCQQKNLTLNEYGLYKISDKNHKKPMAGKTEEEVYKTLGLQWIPPELREDRGEIEAARQHKLPRLVEEKDVLGDFHNHTNLTDGENTIEQMAEAAWKRGWAWYFCGDHSMSLNIANGLSPEAMRVKFKKMEKLKKKYAPKGLYTSSEVDILKAGELDYPPEILKSLDCVVAAVHTRFTQTKDEMTSRLINAVKNPNTDILGHISGRRLGKREGYDFDYDRVFDAAKEAGIALEVNGQPERMELIDIYVKRAIAKGIPLVLSTDAHSTTQLDHMRLAVHIARRGWAEPRHIINTQSEKSVVEWLNS